MQWSKAVTSGIAAVALGFAYQPMAFAADDATVSVDRLEQRILELEDRLAVQVAVSADSQRLVGEIVTLRDEVTEYEPVGAAANGLNISGFVGVAWGYNENDPSGAVSGRGFTNELRTNDTSSETFNVQAAVLTFDALADEPGEAGALIELWYGSTDPLFADWFSVAYINYILENQPVEIIAGRFYTYVGYETIKAHNNGNFGRSLQYGLQPIVHTGVGAIWTINDNWTFSKYIVNGIDEGVNNNDDYGFGGQLAYSGEVAGYETNAAFNYLFGAFNSTDENLSFLLNKWSEVVINESWKVAFEWTYTEEETGPSTADKAWAVGKYITYTQNETLNYVLRTEFLETVTSGAVADAWSITATANWWVTSNLLVRGELRYDDSDGAPVFQDSLGGTSSASQLTFFMSATALFGNEA
jgi:hypothetical protein